MKHSTAATLALSLLLPTAGCSLLGKAGINVSGPGVSSTPGQRAPMATQPAAVQSQPNSSATSQPAILKSAPAAPAAQVADSVPSIPAAMVVAAAQGAPVISLQGVSWCGDSVKGLDWDDGKIDRVFPKQIKKADNLHSSGIESMSEMGRFACGGKQSADRLSWVQSYMQARANETGMTQEQQLHLMGTVAPLRGFDLRDFSNEAPEQCESFKSKGNPNALESQRNHSLRIGMGCSDGGNADWMAWWMDRGETIPSQLESLGWLYSTYAYTSRVASFARGAMALHDAENFDNKAFFAELAKLGADDTVIAKSIMQYTRFATKFKEWKAHHSEDLGEDYALLTQVANAGFSDWVNSYQQNKAAVDFAFQMEEALLEGDSRLFAGCSEKAQGFATEFVMRNSPKTAEEIQNAAAHPIGSLIVAAAYECEKALKNPLAASMYAQMLQSAPRSRGPRFASRLALVRAIAEVKAVRSRFPLKTKDFLPPTPNSGFGKAQRGYFSNASGVIAKVTKNGDTTSLTFKKESWKVAVYKCKETHRLERIESDGTLVYRKKCKQTGTKTVVSQEKPLQIPAITAGDIKSGSFVVASRSRDDKSRGIPKEVYKSKKRERLLRYYGLPLGK